MLSIFDKISQFFKRNNKMSSEDQPQQNGAPKAKMVPRKHKYEIQVYEADWEGVPNDGQPNWKPVMVDPRLSGGKPTIIEVANKHELNDIQQQYSMCGQMFKIIREIDPFVDDPKPDSAENARNDASSKKAHGIPTNNQAVPIESRAREDGISAEESSIYTAQCPTKPTNMKPKIVVIGDIEVKYDGEKVYQKQWMKLTPAEASNFRVVNDANNKIVNLNGKHIEAKRWIRIEENATADDSNTVEKLIEG